MRTRSDKADRIRKPGASHLPRKSPKEIIESKFSSSTTPSGPGQEGRDRLFRKPRCFLPQFHSASFESGLKARSRPGNRHGLASPPFTATQLGERWARLVSGRLLCFRVRLFVRLIALTRLTSSPSLFPSGSDMHFYDDWARQILHGRFTDHLAFYGLPLYAYLLAFFYKIFGYSPFVPGFFQACLNAGTATLLYKIAVRIFRNEGEPIRARQNVIGVLAAAGWAFFVPAQAYSVILMPTSWLVFVFWFVVWQIVRADHVSHSPALPRLWDTHRNHCNGRCHDPLHCSPGPGCSFPETATR